MSWYYYMYAESDALALKPATGGQGSMAALLAVNGSRPNLHGQNPVKGLQPVDVQKCSLCTAETLLTELQGCTTMRKATRRCALDRKLSCQLGMFCFHAGYELVLSQNLLGTSYSAICMSIFHTRFDQ